jgi:hypothetical protein
MAFVRLIVGRKHVADTNYLALAREQLPTGCLARATIESELTILAAVSERSRILLNPRETSELLTPFRVRIEVGNPKGIRRLSGFVQTGIVEMTRYRLRDKRRYQLTEFLWVGK